MATTTAKIPETTRIKVTLSIATSNFLSYLVLPEEGREAPDERYDRGGQSHDKDTWKNEQDQREYELNSGFGSEFLGPLSSLDPK
jgi:hypothetical protein